VALNNLTQHLALRRQSVQPTILPYVGSAVAVALNIMLVVAILGDFGVETTTFAAFTAAVGIAIGAACSGLLANFAAGAFSLIRRPFKAGDFVLAGGMLGTVETVGLFVTTINTLDNVQTFVGNGKIRSDTVQNVSTNPHRRADLVAEPNHGVDVRAATALLQERLDRIPNVKTMPPPGVEILTFTPQGPVPAVRPYCHNDHSWQVYFDTNRTIREAFGDAAFPVPEQHVFLRNAS
jgi:small conductance mechanosensitive channel